MSQVVRISRTQMVEQEYLIKAIEDLGYAWKGDARLGLAGPRVDIKIQRRNIGFRMAGKAYEMVTRGATTRQKRFLQQVTQRYIYHVTRTKLEQQGFTLASEEVQQDGRVHLVLRRMV
jgi:hypothetical protein